MTTKLTRAQVIDARARVAGGAQVSQLAASLPVTVSVLARAVRGVTWASVPGALPGYRLAHGEAHPRARLTDTKVLELRARWAGGATITSLADEEGLARMTVSRAVQGFSWKHLGFPVVLGPPVRE